MESIFWTMRLQVYSFGMVMLEVITGGRLSKPRMRWQASRGLGERSQKGEAVHSFSGKPMREAFLAGLFGCNLRCLASGLSPSSTDPKVPGGRRLVCKDRRLVGVRDWLANECSTCRAVDDCSNA